MNKSDVTCHWCVLRKDPDPQVPIVVIHFIARDYDERVRLCEVHMKEWAKQWAEEKGLMFS